MKSDQAGLTEDMIVVTRELLGSVDALYKGTPEKGRKVFRERLASARSYIFLAAEELDKAKKVSL